MKRFSFVFIVLLFSSCAEQEFYNFESKSEYIKSVEQWDIDRLNRLKSATGWLSLSGLFWLHEGENTLGRDSSNSLIYNSENAPAFLGKFVLKSDTVRYFAPDSLNIMAGTQKVDSMILQKDNQENTTFLTYGSLNWHIIKREERLGIRMKDSLNEALVKFPGIERFPIQSDWYLKAKFVEYQPPKTIELPDITGKIENVKSPGCLEFTIDGVLFTLDALEGGNELFIVFADETSAETTYGGGRFLYVSLPDSLGNTFIDFNKAYNPPCAFTEFATCPTPPKSNFLKIRIEAGEKNFGNH